MIFLGHWVNERIICPYIWVKQVVELDWMVARGGDKTATGRASELHVRIDGHRKHGLCRIDGGVRFKVLGRLGGIKEVDWAGCQE